MNLQSQEPPFILPNHSLGTKFEIKNFKLHSTQFLISNRMTVSNFLYDVISVKYGLQFDEIFLKILYAVYVLPIFIVALQKIFEATVQLEMKN